MNDIKDRYESLRYDTIPFVQTHPVHLATLAQLHYMQPVDPRRCRYLEVGCADGLNIIGMALAFPESQFVGIDLAETSIQQGQAMVEKLQLKNVQLLCGDILQFPLDAPPFDYIVAHGFYAWVPEHVQQHLWLMCQKLLSQQGVAYISYNTYPGCFIRRMLREMMLFHVRGEETPEGKVYQAKAFLQFLDHAQAMHGDVVATIRHEIDQLLHFRHDFSIYHDDLGPINAPLYFHQFAALAAQHGFQFLSEADYFEMCYNHFPEGVQAHLRNMEQHDFLIKEQYLDFLKLRRFRESLICRSSCQIVRTVSPDRVREQLYTSFSSVEGDFDLAPETAVTFKQEKGARISVNHVLSKIALQLLGTSFPRQWSFDELVEAAEPIMNQANLGPISSDDQSLLANTLLSAYSVGLIKMQCLPTAMALTIPDRPQISPLVAEQLKAGNTLVSNLMHLPVHIETDFIRGFLLLCDGSRTKEAIIEDCRPLHATNEIPVAERVDRALKQGLQLGLFVG